VKRTANNVAQSQIDSDLPKKQQRVALDLCLAKVNQNACRSVFGDGRDIDAFELGGAHYAFIR